MLTLVIHSPELYDESSNRFLPSTPIALTLEHSLASVSKWESIWHKPFLTTGERTPEETLSYIRCMVVGKDMPSDAYRWITQSDIDTVNAYIEDSMTATTFAKDDKLKSKSREIITSEIIYWWMIQAGIPFECQRWHLNRLITLINVVNLKRAPAKKMSRSEILARNRALNAERLAKHHTRG